MFCQHTLLLLYSENCLSEKRQKWLTVRHDSCSWRNRQGWIKTISDVCIVRIFVMTEADAGLIRQAPSRDICRIRELRDDDERGWWASTVRRLLMREGRRWCQCHLLPSIGTSCLWYPRRAIISSPPISPLIRVPRNQRCGTNTRSIRCKTL